MLKVLQNQSFASYYARLDAQSVTQCARGLLKDDSLFAAHHLNAYLTISYYALHNMLCAIQYNVR